MLFHNMFSHAHAIDANLSKAGQGRPAAGVYPQLPDAFFLAENSRQKGFGNMRSFPLFSELEAHRDKANEAFHHNVKPVLMERLQEFGFAPASEASPGILQLTEAATDNCYILAIHPYELDIHFQHVKTGEQILICSISNLELSAHVMMEIIIDSIDSWLQYGVIYDYAKAQLLEERAKARA